MVWYKFNVVAVIVISLVLRGACDIEPKSSIAFVIDKTLSMEPVIERVRSNVKDIFDTILNSDTSPVENFVLVLFGDPHVTEPLVTNDRKVLESALESVEPEDGGLCPEKALTGIQKAINASLPGSYVYVFTDASADDYTIYDEVRRSAEEKQCQIVFILTGTCEHRTELSDDYVVYPNLAEATSGQVFTVTSEDDIDKILEFVKNSIDSRRITLLSKKFSASDDKSFSVEVDSTMDQLTVSITITGFGSGSHLDVSIFTPENYTVDEEPLVKLGDVLIKRDIYSVPGLSGKYYVQCYSNVSTYVIVTARSNVRFLHGFSTELVSTLFNTVIGPIEASKNYLYIQLFGENVVLTFVELLDPNYRRVLLLPLKMHDEKQQLYVTELFNPPLAKFRISVIGSDGEGNSIRRYGNLVIETEIPRPPRMNITGETLVEYNGVLQLNCSVDAFPKPRIFWERLSDGSKMASKEGPRNNMVLNLENRIRNESFGCYAENAVGKTREIVQVKVKPKLFIKLIQGPEDQILDYNAKGVLHCIVNAYPPAKISWKLNEKQKVSMKDGNIMLSSDNSSLTITHMTRQTLGRYACQIEYLHNVYIYNSRVDWTARKPMFEGMSDVNYFFEKGDDVNLKCTLLAGKPGPVIKWYFRWSGSRSSYKELKEYMNWQSIIIPKAGKLNTGAYACIARNEVGRDIRNFNVYFQKHKPKVELDTGENKMADNTIVVELNSPMVIKCIVEGAPTPEVTWIKNHEQLKMDNITIRSYRSYPEYGLVIAKASLEHSGTYKCKAANSKGHASASVNVTVYYIQVKSPLDSTDIETEENHNVDLPCGDYITGDPKLKFKWKFIRFNEAAIRPVKISKLKLRRKGEYVMHHGNLQIAKISKNQRGFYICIACNLGGSANITFKVNVLFPPQMLEDKKTYKAVEGDRALRIFCNVTGNPEPTVTWVRNGLALAGGDTENGKSLTLRDISHSDRGQYSCTATSKRFPDDEAFGIITVNVYRFPRASSAKTTTQHVELGTTQEINCNIPYTSVDSVYWWFKNKKIIPSRGNKLILTNATKSDSGYYTCRVNKLESLESENANTYVEVKRNVPRTRK